MSILTQVEDLAIEVSNRIIMPHFASVQASNKSDGSLITEVDLNAHHFLTAELVKIADYPVLSEEMTADEQQQIILSEPSSYWCIDPIDGTSNFVQGVPYWCVSIALIIDGQQKLGVVYDPNRNESFAATDNERSTLNGKPLLVDEYTRATEIENCMGLIDFKRLPEKVSLSLVSKPPYRSQRSFGASALDLCWIAANRCHVYLHGKQKLWDHAAGLLILQQVGGDAETFQGECLFQNDLIPKTVIAASTSTLMQKWKNYFQQIQ